MNIEVGSRVTFQTRDGVWEGTVLSIQNEHAQCQFADGRSAWLPIAQLVPSAVPASFAPVPLATSAPVAPSFVPPPIPSHFPPPVEPPSADTPLSPPLIALIYLGLTIVPLGCTLIGALLYSLPYYIWKKDKPNRARQWQRHVWIAFGAGCLLWFGIWMVGGALYGVTKYRNAAASAGTTSTATASSKTFDDGVCQIVTSSAWTRQDPPQNQAAALELHDTAEDVFVMLVHESTADFDSDLTVERYADLALSDTLRSLSRSEHDFVALGPETALREVRSGSVNGVKLTFEHFYFKTTSHFHQVVACSKARTFAAQRGDLERVAVSVRCGGARTR